MMDEALKRSMQRATDRALAKMDETDRRFEAEQRERHELASAIGDAITAYRAGDRSAEVMNTLEKTGIHMAFECHSVLAVISGSVPDEYVLAVEEEINEARRELGVGKPMSVQDCSLEEATGPWPK